MDKILAETDNYKLYSIADNVYLKDKKKSKTIGWDKIDIYIDVFYGDPNSGLISNNNEYVVVAGDKLVIYNIINDVYLIPSQFSDNWVSGLFQDIGDDRDWKYFRFVSYDGEDKLKIFRIDSKSLEVKQIS
jgi:hypothetical protein